MKEWLLKPAVYRTALVMYVLSLVVLFGAYVGVALWDVNHSVYVQGPASLVRNQPTAIRAIVLHTQTGRLVRKAKSVTLGLVPKDAPKPEDGVKPALLDPISLTKNGKLHTNPAPLQRQYKVNVPAGAYDLVLRGVFSDDEEIFETRTPINVIESAPKTPTWLKHTSRRNTHERDPLHYGATAHVGPVHIGIIPHRPELIRGLTSPLFLVTYDAVTGEPVSCTITWDEQVGLLERPLPKKVKTDQLGLARLSVTPMLSQRWKLKASCSEHETDSTTTVYLETIASQIALSVHDPVSQAGSKINGHVTSLHRRGLAHIDLRSGHRWLTSSAFGLGPGKSGLRLNIEEDLPEQSLARVQVFMDVYMQGRVWDMRYVVIQRGQANSTKALAFVHRQLQSNDTTSLQSYWSSLGDMLETRSANASEKQRRLWLQAMLFAMPRHFDPPRVLLNSLSEDQAKLDAKKKKLRHELMIVIIMAMTVGFIALLATVFRAVQNHQARQRLIDDLAFDLELEEDALESDQALGDPTQSKDAQGMASRRRRDAILMFVQSVMIIGTILVFGAMIIMVLRYL